MVDIRIEQRVHQNEPGIFIDVDTALNHQLIANVFGQATVIAVAFKDAHGASGYWMNSYWPHYAPDQLQDLITTLQTITATHVQPDIQVAVIMMEEDVDFLPDYSYQGYLQDIKAVCARYRVHSPLVIPYQLSDFSGSTGEKYVALFHDSQEGVILQTWAGQWIMQS